MLTREGVLPEGPWGWLKVLLLSALTVTDS